MLPVEAIAPFLRFMPWSQAVLVMSATVTKSSVQALVLPFASHVTLIQGLPCALNLSFYICDRVALIFRGMSRPVSEFFQQMATAYNRDVPCLPYCQIVLNTTTMDIFDKFSSPLTSLLEKSARSWII